ncbi:MAG: hypothetical protein V7724_19075 [Sediminicola sp.]
MKATKKEVIIARAHYCKGFDRYRGIGPSEAFRKAHGHCRHQDVRPWADGLDLGVRQNRRTPLIGQQVFPSVLLGYFYIFP